jgi:hypothetical protein
MKKRLNLESYGAQEITTAEARDINGGLLWLIPAAVGAAAGYGVYALYSGAFTKGAREACSVCN